MSTAKKNADRRVDKAYRATCAGIAVNILDIGKIFELGRLKVAQGETNAELAASIRAYVETIRQD